MASTLDNHDTAPLYPTDPTPVYKDKRPDSAVGLSPEETREVENAARESEHHLSTEPQAVSAEEIPNIRLSLEDILKGLLRVPFCPENSIEEPPDEEQANDAFKLERYRADIEQHSDNPANGQDNRGQSTTNIEDHPGKSTINVSVGQGQWRAAYQPPC